MKLQPMHSANAPAHALRMMKAERLSGLQATRATPGDAEVTGKVGQVPLWPRISRRRAGRRRTDPDTLETPRRPLSFMKRGCTYLKWKPPDVIRVYGPETKWKSKIASRACKAELVDKGKGLTLVLTRYI